MLFLSCFVFAFMYVCFFVVVVFFFGAGWSPAGKGVASWLSFVVSGCDVVAFPLVS